ncbi:MAG: cAMP-activated global transcriptional regulator CRP [Pseudomonadota bacterium]|nr:cAMP-activated global transcriptional regulator CRP [Pseudomonadota bacterium]
MYSTSRNLSRYAHLPAHVSPSIKTLLDHAHIRSFPTRHSIVHAGDASTSLFFLLKGSVSIVVEESGQREIVVAYLNAGDFFGEMGLFEEQPQRTAWVKTRSACEIAEISYDKFHELARIYPDLTFAVFAQMSLRLKKTTRKVTDLAFLDVTGRIARCLLDLAAQPDTLKLVEGRQIRITRQEIGRLVGCSREMVGRVLKSLEEQSMIRCEGKAILIYDQV